MVPSANFGSSCVYANDLGLTGYPDRPVWCITGRRRHDEAADAFFAATAECNELTLVTPNVRDFEGLGIPLHNPWGQPQQ